MTATRDPDRLVVESVARTLIELLDDLIRTPPPERVRACRRAAAIILDRHATEFGVSALLAASRAVEHDETISSGKDLAAFLRFRALHLREHDTVRRQARE